MGRPYDRIAVGAAHAAHVFLQFLRGSFCLIATYMANWVSINSALAC